MSEMGLTLRIKVDADGTIRAVGQVSKAVGDLGPQAQRTGRDAEKGFSRARRGVESISTSLQRMQRMAVGAATALVGLQQARRAIRAVTTELGGFEETLSGVRAVTRASAQEMGQLESAARQLGASTRFSASEAAEGMRFLGMAGYETSQIIEAMPAVLNLATAASMDLGRAADVASNVLSAFNLNTAETARVADVMAAAASAANTNVDQLAEALRPVGGVARSLGITLEDTTAALSTLAQAGRQGGEAGTGLRRILTSLINPTAEAESTIRQLGLTLEDIDPRAMSLTEVIQRLADAGIEADQAFRIFGDRGTPALLDLVGQIPELRRLTGVMGDVKGLAEEMSDVMNDNLRGDMLALSSALAELIQKMGEAGLLDALRAAVQATTTFARALSGNEEAAEKLSGALQVLTDACIVLASVITARLGTALLTTTGSLTALNFALLAATIQTRALAVATRAGAAAYALMGGPIGLVAGALALAIVRGRQMDEQVRQIGATSAKTTEAFKAMDGAISGAFDASKLNTFQQGLDNINREIELAEALLERARQRSQIGRGGIAGEARLAAGFDPQAAGAAGALAIAEENVRVLREERDARLEVAAARAAIAAAFPDEAERYALGAQKIAEWSETAIGFLEGFGLVARNAAGGIGEMAAASEEITGPLDAQVEQLRQQVFLLEHGEAAMVDYMEAQAMARAALQDVTDGTTANVEATQRYFQAIRSLTEQERHLREEQEARAASQQASAGFARQLAALNREAEALAGGAEAWRAYQRELFITQELTKLGTAATEEQIRIITEAAQRVFDLREAAAGEGSQTFFGLDLDWVMGRLEEVKAELEEIAQIEWGFENLIDSFNPLAAQMRRLGEEIDLIDEALSRGLITNFQAGMARTAVAADAAFAAMMAGVDRTSKEYRQLEVAQQAVNVALGIAAILQQGMGDPYTAIPRMIAMAAMVSQLVDGISGLSGGGGGGAAQRQEQQGTGSVLGDAEAQSESILRATEITADATQELVGINRGMLRALQALQSGIAGASGMLARGAGQADFEGVSVSGTGPMPQIFADIGKALDPIGIFHGIFNSIHKWFGGKAKVRDQGIEILGGTLGELIEGTIVGAYQEIRYRKWRFGSNRSAFEFSELDDDIGRQFSLIFEAIAESVLQGAIALGLGEEEIRAAMARYEVAAQQISLMDLSAEEQQAELEAVFGQIFDGLAGEVVPWIRQFQQVGEGLGETLVRVATGVQVMHEAISRLGFSLDEADPEKFAQASEGLIGLMGGLDEFINGLVNFFDKFADEATRFAIAQGDLERAFEQVGLALPASRNAMWELMQSLDATTESGREQIAMLLELTDVADAYYSFLEAVENERLGLERRILQIQGDTAALRQLELEKLHESNRELQQRIWALEEEIELAGIMAQAGDEIARLSMSPLRFEFRQLSQAQRELTARVRELTDSEEKLAQIRLQHDLQNMALAERAMARLSAIQEQLWGAPGSSNNAGPDFTPIDQAVLRVRDSLIRALESVAEWVRRSSFMDPSLRPVDQLAAMQAEFDRLMNIALTGSGQEQADAIAALPQLASQMEAVAAQVWGTATSQFQEFRGDLVEQMQHLLDSVVPPPAPDPVTGAQIGGIAGAIDQVVLTLAEQKMLAAEALEVLGVIRALTGESPLEIAREFGVPLRDAIELLIGDLGEGTAETIEQLAHIANTLGVNLTELSDELGLNIGQLIDHESLLSQALRDVIDGLPAGIQDELLEPLMRIWSATSEADANEALAELLAMTDELPAWIRNVLAPYFEEIDPVDYLTEQVGLLEVMREYDRRQAEAAEQANTLLSELLQAVRDANSFTDVPGYASGGWVNSNQIIRAGEAGRELILPNPVSEFLAREGLPVRAVGGSNVDSVTELRRIAQLLEDGNRDRREAASDQIVVVTDLKAELADINQSIAREGVNVWPTR